MKRATRWWPPARRLPTAASGVSSFDPARTCRSPSSAHTGYQFDAAGQVVATRSYAMGAASTAATSQRNSVIPAQPGTWFLIDNGVWAGFSDRSNRDYLAGFREQVAFSPTRSVSFASGAHTGTGPTPAAASPPRRRTPWPPARVPPHRAKPSSMASPTSSLPTECGRVTGFRSRVEWSWWGGLDHAAPAPPSATSTSPAIGRRRVRSVRP